MVLEKEQEDRRKKVIAVIESGFDGGIETNIAIIKNLENKQSYNDPFVPALLYGPH